MAEFRCESYAFAPDTGTLALRYAFDDGPRFEERIVFPAAARTLGAPDSEALDRVFRLLLLACGVSYYKAFAPERVRCTAFALDPVTAAFFTEFYRRGLGEFAWRNRVDLSRLHFAVDAAAPPDAVALSLPRRTCVPVGGGKDSIVTLECLKQAGEPLLLFSLGRAAPIEATIAHSGLPAFHVTRRLDPALFELNRCGALNGHVPITGILSLIAIASAILVGFDTVAMSNEHSASAPNVADVNHQYSKSFAFEDMLAGHLERHVASGLEYFSLLRPLSDVDIARRFARRASYLPVFRSCNAAFRQVQAERARHWCCDCPKCRFAFLLLAPFVERADLIATFGSNLLDEPAQIGGFEEICGLERHKPFECVGEVAESATVMAHLAASAPWRGDAVVRALAPRLPAGDLETLLARREPHRVPARFLAMLDACG